MRVAIINPNTNASTTAAMVAIAREAAPGGMEIAGVTAAFGVPLITNPAALGVAAEAVLALAEELAGFDGVIVAAFGDPGREALAARLSCPVVGIAEASMAEAARLSHGRFAVVTTTPDLTGSIRVTAQRYGLQAALASVHVPGAGDPARLMADSARLDEALTCLIGKAVALDGARAIVIGGGPLAAAARRLAPRFAVPIVEPIPAAVAMMAAALARKAPTA